MSVPRYSNANLSHRENRNALLGSTSSSSTPSGSGRQSPNPHTFSPSPNLTARSQSPFAPLQGSAMSSRTGVPSLEALESQNDERIEGLGARVKMLKDITIGIGDEIRESNTFLGSMNGQFTNTGSFLGGTMRRINHMASTQGSRWFFYMIFIVIVLWIFIFTWWSRR